jgi:hypothetical protein
MCNQNIISNKFDLKLVTMFSSYWCTAIFAKSHSLHYVLKKLEVDMDKRQPRIQTQKKERRFKKNDTQKQRQNQKEK